LVRCFSDIHSFVERRMKNLLVVEDDEIQRNSILEVIGNGDVQSTAVGSAAEALEALKQQHFDCMVLDLLLPDLPGLDLLREIKQQPRLRNLPIVVHTGKDLGKKDETELRKLAQSIIVKDVRS